MRYLERDLIIVPEGVDEETGQPTMWAIRSLFDSGNKRYHYIWIELVDDHEYAVVNSDGYNLAGKVYRTLGGAKRCAEGIMWRQEETGCFTN